MKKIYSFVIMIIVMAMLVNATAFAGSSAAKIKVMVNEKEVKYGVKPYLEKGEVILPLRKTAEALGAKVEWDGKNKTAWVHLDMMHIEVPVGKSEFYIHRDADFSGIPQTVKLNTPIKKVKGSVVVPGKIFFENIGATVTWDSKKGIFEISYNNLPTDVAYEEITVDNITGNSTLMKWYNENNQKPGISYIKDGEYIYALIGGGERPTGGYTISIDSIYFSSEDTVTINAKVTPPGDNVRVIMVITYPSMLIRMKADKIKSVVGEVVDAKTTGKEKWVTMDLNTVTKMELFNLDQVKLRDITGSEKDEIMKSFNEATLNQNPYIEMIAGNILKVTINDGTVLTFTSYGSETNVIVNFEKDGEVRTFHLVAPVIAKTLLSK
jgi:hypothetical protein